MTLKKQFMSEKAALRISQFVGLSKEEYFMAKGRLQNKFKKEPSPNDVLWSIYNHKIIEYCKKSDLHSLQTTYYEMALFLDKEGKPSFKISQQSCRMKLENYKQTALVTNVQILCAGDSCDNCKKLAGRVMRVEEAIKVMPLPVKNCTRPLYQKNAGFCRCTYSSS